MLFNNQTVDGVSAEFVGCPGSMQQNIYVSGNFGGGTATLEAMAPNGDWVPIPGAQFTAPELGVIKSAPFRGRISLSGSTSPDINAWVEEDTTVVRTRVGSV